jgi:hypothetical protein
MVCKIVNCSKTSRKGAKIANLSTIGSLRALHDKMIGEQKIEHLPSGREGASQQKCNHGSVVKDIITTNRYPETRNLFLPSRP